MSRLARNHGRPDQPVPVSGTLEPPIEPTRASVCRRSSHSRASARDWWQNQRPGRTEFPRTLEEFTTLGIYEAGGEFEAPQTPADIRGLHFRHHRRPGQGILTGKPTLGLELVLVSPRDPGGAQALRDWADFVHIRYIAAAAVPGFTMITPYENVTGGTPRFMHFYEMDTSFAEETFQRMTPTTRERQIGRNRPLWKEWSGHEQLAIDYVNTFTRIGERVGRKGSSSAADQPRHLRSRSRAESSATPAAISRLRAGSGK